MKILTYVILSIVTIIFSGYGYLFYKAKNALEDSERYTDEIVRNIGDNWDVKEFYNYVSQDDLDNMKVTSKDINNMFDHLKVNLGKIIKQHNSECVSTYNFNLDFSGAHIQLKSICTTLLECEGGPANATFTFNKNKKSGNWHVIGFDIR